MKISNLFLSSFICALASCGGGGGGNSADSALTGTFVDSPVINIGYRTATQNGNTNSRGEFRYLAGERVTFFIGDLEFPAVLGDAVITPLDMAGTDNPFEPMVINIIRLLQTLDKDSDPSNGITITDVAKTNAIAIDFDLSIDDFELSIFLGIDFINAGQDTLVTELFDVEIVLNHFVEQLDELDLLPEFVTTPDMSDSIFGTWRSRNMSSDEFMILSFFDDLTYVHAEVHNADPSIVSGMEWGSFFRDFIDRTTTSVSLDNNGSAGLSDFSNNSAPNLRLVNSRISSETLVVSVDEDGDNFSDESISFDRIISEGLLGTWVGSNAAAELLMISFFDDGVYFQAEIDRDDPTLMSGMELGTYSRDTETGLLTVTQTFDNNGRSGLTDFTGIGAPNIFVVVSGDTLTATIDEDGDTVIDETIVFQRQ